MIDQSFTCKQFKKLQKRGDFLSQNIDTKVLKQKLTDLEVKLNDIDQYSFSALKSIKKDDKKIYFLDKKSENYIFDDFILRKINHNIKRIYKVKQSNRNTIISQIYNLLKENLKCYIYRLDIHSFYESIDRAKILQKIIDSSIVSAETKILLEKFFEYTKECSGLPRGINISATLSELYMNTFDHKIVSTRGVYYYARFVDDIIIFSYEKLETSDLEKILTDETGLIFNSLKTKELCLDFVKDEVLEYLGYQYIIKTNKKNNGIDSITVNISKKKLNKIKSKIIYALLDYNKNKNFKLLQNRFLLLTCTYPIKTSQQKISPYKNTGYLQAGLFFNYLKLSDNNSSLQELDNFKLKILTHKNKYSKYLNIDQKRQLLKYSFKIAYSRKLTRKCWGKYKQLKNFMRCWKYV